VDQSPVERQVRDAGLLGDEIDLQWDGDHEPGNTESEETHEARFVGVAVGEQCGEIAAVPVQADEYESCEVLSASIHEITSDFSIYSPA
jgi:hypothetical protein